MACRISAGHAVRDMSTDLVGSEWGRRHLHRRDRSAPLCGVSRGPRAYRVRVPIVQRILTSSRRRTRLVQ